MKFLFLYAELMPNLISVLRTLIEQYSADIHVVYWDNRKKTPYIPATIKGINFYKRSEYGFKKIINLVENIKPDSIYVVGWMDYTYLWIVAFYRRKGIPIIVGFDDWWKGTFKQLIAKLISPIITKVFFSHAQVSGPRQYEYAKRLGFNDKAILQNLLSCDTEIFRKGYLALENKRKEYPNTYLYVGRFSPEKGIDLLAAAFEKYRTYYNGKWNLVCIGNGPLLDTLNGRSGIVVRGFTTQAELLKAMMDAGVFVLASIRDLSPLVVHEAACAGMPMILSSNVGNIPLFMIHNYNGLVFDAGAVDELAKALYFMSIKSIEELILMGERSHKLSHRFDPEMVAASFVSCIQNK
jgi:glycosyltransferase involved in cell wall biosynthesis